MFVAPTTMIVRQSEPHRAGRAWLPTRPWQPVLVVSTPYPGFTQETITWVNPPELVGSQYFFSWETTSPPGTWWQIYFDGGLVWTGQRTSALIPVPLGVERIDIGMVGAGYETTSWSSELPPAPARRAVLSWVGGAFLGDDIAGFYVYAAASAGGMINYTTPAATITAYPVGIMTDGFGLGGFGLGGFGSVGGTYTWSSPTLQAGTWSFAVVPFDSIGNAGTGTTVNVAIASPPLEMPAFEDRTRMHYTYNQTAHTVTVNWIASPG